MTPQQRAFLSMLAVSEGTKGKGDDGYNVLVGGHLFQSYADHPRILVDLGHGLKSTAAGRYQLLARTYDALRQQLGLTDFGHDAQDACALELIRECHAFDLIEAGNLPAAVAACAHIWASLPGAGYGQHENQIAMLRQAFLNAGGIVTA